MYNFENRAGDVDLLRAFGIILMIMGHVWFGGSFSKWIHGFHMPLWFMVSGFFFNTRMNPALYVKRKVKAILIPYFAFSICYEIIWMLAGHNQWLGLIWPNSIQIPLNNALWFLPALFIVDVAGVILFRYLKRNLACIALFVLAVFGSLNLISLPLSMDSAFVGCGFFLAGYLIRKYEMKLLRIRMILAVCLMLVASVFIMLNEYVNVRTNEYAIIPAFWLNAVLATVALWNICRWVDERKHAAECTERVLLVLKEIGSDSLVYVCTNQFILFFLKKLPIPESNMVVMLIWHLVEVIIIITVCFATNRIIKKTPFKIVLGK